MNCVQQEGGYIIWYQGFD